ncbi:MAG: hypothetical protein EZS28_044707, partial [Streblomastix strix]
MSKMEKDKPTQKTKQEEDDEWEYEDEEEEEEEEEEDYDDVNEDTGLFAAIKESQPFTFVKRTELQKDIDKKINEISTTYCLSTDEATLLLIQYKWKTDKFVSAYLDSPDACLMTVGINKSIKQHKKKKHHHHSDQSPESEQMCPICFCPIEPDEEAVLPCGHKFGLDCVQLHINTLFMNGSASITIGCPEKGCNGKIFPSMIRQVLASYIPAESGGNERSLIGLRAVEQYNVFIQDNYIESQRSKLCFCPNPRCAYVAKCEDLLRHDVRCICGQSYWALLSVCLNPQKVLGLRFGHFFPLVHHFARRWNMRIPRAVET